MTTTARTDGATQDTRTRSDASAVAEQAVAMLEEAADEMDRTGRHDMARSHRAHARELRDTSS